MSETQTQLTTRLITAQDTRIIRGAILRPGLPFSESVYQGDDAPDSFHLGLFMGDELAGISSYFSQPMPEPDAALVRRQNPALLEGHHWRLRGMAIDAPYQRRGYGKILLRAGLAHLAERGGGWLWFNARSCAREFYASLGCQTWGEEYDVPGVGPHFMMTYRVPAAS